MNLNVNLMEENVIQINGGITIYVDVNVKNIIYMKKIIFGTLLHVDTKLEKYLVSVIDDSVITCDEIIEEETKIVTTNFNEANAICKTRSLYILRAFLLIAIALLIAVSIYCYLIKYKAKQKQLLPFYITNKELKEVFITHIL